MAGEKRAAAYVRVSSVGRRDRESASYGTEDEQAARCRAYAAAKGWEVVDVCSDIDVSGGSWDRAGLDRVLEMARAGQIDALVVYRLSRLGRSLRGVLDTVVLLDDLGVTIASVEEGIDRSTAAGRMLFNVLASFDEYERELRGEYWAGVKARARARGVLIGPTPFGYQRHDGGDQAGVLFPCPDRGPVVEAIFEMRAERAPYERIASMMDERAPRDDGKRWSVNQVRRIVMSRVYRGEVHQAGGVHLDAHPWIVTEDQWQAAQGVRTRPPTTSELHDFVLSGVLRCASCGQTMAGQARGGGGRPVYRCRRRTAAGVCSAPVVVTAEPVEGLIVGAVLERLRGRAAEGVSDPGVDLAELERAAAAAGDEVRFYLAQTELRATIGEQSWREGLDARLAARDAAERAVADARQRAASSAVRMTADDVQADPELLRAAVRGEVVSATVARGRGVPVAERVAFSFAD